MGCRILRNDLLAKPMFWATHYYLLIGNESVDSSEVIEPYFGVTNADSSTFYLRELSENAGTPESPFPYLDVPIREGFSVQVEYVGEPDPKISYLIAHSDWQSPVELGHSSGHFALPAFRWEEARDIALAADLASAYLAFLLVFPGVWLRTDDECAEARSFLIRAWMDARFVQRQYIGDLVSNIVAYQTVKGLLWWRDQKLGWVTDGACSFRNPSTRMCDLSLERFMRMAEFQAMLDRKHSDPLP